MLRLLRWLAVVGMLLAVIDFAQELSLWISPLGGPWVGKRTSEALGPQPPGVPRDAQLQQWFRSEVRNLYAGLREPSKWFLIASIAYLLARRQERTETPPDAG